MRVLSLFDGMACGRIAFEQLGIKVDSYDAFEIDKYAIQVATHNFPDIVEHGDVFNGDFTQFTDVDWLVGGSPCTYWSIAQTTNRREKVASGIGWELFSQYLRAIDEAKPKFFLYENNKSMSAEIRRCITQSFGFEPVMLNSALVSAQSRQRLYWVGIRTETGYKRACVPPPQDRGILLKDILETGVPLNVTEQAKAWCLPSNRGGNSLAHDLWKNKNSYSAIPCYSLQGDSIKEYAGSDVQRIGTIESDVKNKANDSKQYRVYSTDEKAVTLCASGGGSGKATGLYAVNLTPDGKSMTLIAQYKKQSELNIIGDSHSHGCSGVAESVMEHTWHDKNVYIVKDGQIQINGKDYPIKLNDGAYIVRKLTVNECKHLQTVPEWYDMTCISNSQIYKCLGNGWTIEIIMHLIKSALDNGIDNDAKMQLSLF